MSDKTRLELDIEHREKIRTPASVKTLIILLGICLCFFGIYTYKLRTELLRIEQDAVVMKADFKKEKIQLLRQIKQLQARQDFFEQDMNLRDSVLSN